MKQKVCNGDTGGLNCCVCVNLFANFVFRSHRFVFSVIFVISSLSLSKLLYEQKFFRFDRIVE